MFNRMGEAFGNRSLVRGFVSRGNLENLAPGFVFGNWFGNRKW